MSSKSVLIALSVVGIGGVALAGSHQQIQAILGNVYLQSTTPGTVQVGHASITGTFRAGQVLGSSASAATTPIVGNNTATSGISVGGSFSSASTAGKAVRGTATATSGATRGVYGETRSTAGMGVYGIATAAYGIGTYGIGNYGVEGDSHNDNGVGGRFYADGSGAYGIYSTVGSNSLSAGIFVYPGTNGYAVYGLASGGTGPNSGGYFQTDSTTGRGIFASAHASSGVSYGVYVVQQSNSGYGVMAAIPPASNGYAIYGSGGAGGTGYAGYFVGRMTTTGTKAFQIDHPTNPENAYLNHYCSESPEPLNEYRGTVVLDNNGEAWVKLPNYFDQINKDPSYTLTAVGASMPGLYVAKEVSDNRFKVSGGVAGKKVSWRVTATRNDRFVRTYGAPVEQLKPRQFRGTYLQPELYGQPETKGQFYAPTPDQAPPLR